MENLERLEFINIMKSIIFLVLHVIFQPLKMPYFSELEKALKTRHVSGFFNFKQKEKPSCYKVDA